MTDADVQGLRPLVHRLSNQLQHALMHAELLAQEVRSAPGPAERYREPLATIVERLEDASQLTQEIQAALHPGAGELSGSLSRARGSSN